MLITIALVALVCGSHKAFNGLTVPHHALDFFAVELRLNLYDGVNALN